MRNILQSSLLPLEKYNHRPLTSFLQGHQKTRMMVHGLLPAHRAIRGDTFHISLMLHQAKQAPLPRLATKPLLKH